MSPSRALLLQQSNCLNIVLHARDSYTHAHSSRVEGLSLALGGECGLDASELELLRIAAMLHDIGKIGIPDHILLKPARLEPEEWEIMKTHATIGQDFCNAIPHEDSHAVGRVVRHHHESFDGSGYPDGLSGEAIPIASRIIAIADSYDAMTSARPYHRPRTHDQAMRILVAETGQRTDPYIFRRFEAVIKDSECSS